MSKAPGFFSFRWRPKRPSIGLEDIAVVFKVPGDVDLAVLPDLLEDSCRGPVVPHAVVLIHLPGDSSLSAAMQSPAVRGALLRFDNRMPLLVLDVELRSFSVTPSLVKGLSGCQVQTLRSSIEDDVDEWIEAGLRAIFEPNAVIVQAPAGFSFLKPSNNRSSYFIRAENALRTSGAISFVAAAITKRLIKDCGGLPVGLKVIFVDTMSVATVAYALRELLTSLGVSPLPQVESFHSYDGLSGVVDPLPGSSLCIISASSSMSLHREWIRAKRVYDRDVLTLVTFKDAQDSEYALYGLPASTRPEESASSSKYDIRIAGENFFPVNEPPRKVMLTTTHHASSKLTKIFYDLRGTEVFDVFRSTGPSSPRKGLFVDGERLLRCEIFQGWVNDRLPHWLKAGTAQIIFQPDVSSRILAQHVAYMLASLGGSAPRILSADEVSEHSIEPNAGLVAVGAVVGRGNSLLSLSRELRNVHVGPRLYLIGVQVAESDAYIETFDRNLKHSSAGAVIDVVRMQSCLVGEAVLESFQSELSHIYASSAADGVMPQALRVRRENLRRDVGREIREVFLPSGSDLTQPLVLNEDFAFWPRDYSAGVYQSEVLGTIAGILQNARTSNVISLSHRLRSPMLMQTALSPENFSRFNEGIIQASLLRAALPSELDYRGDADASGFMRQFLVRMTKSLGASQQAELEFLTALAIGRMRLADEDCDLVVSSFLSACDGTATPLAKAIRFLVGTIRHSRDRNEQIAF